MPRKTWSVKTRPWWLSSPTSRQHENISETSTWGSLPNTWVVTMQIIFDLPVLFSVTHQRSIEVKSLAFLVTQRRPAASVSNCQGTEKPTNNWKLRTKKIHTSLTFLGALGTRVGKNRQNMDFQQGVSVQKTWDTPNVYTCMYIYTYII